MTIYTHNCRECGNIIQSKNQFLGPQYCAVCLSAVKQREANPTIYNYISDEHAKAAFAQSAENEKDARVGGIIILVIGGVIFFTIFGPLVIMAVSALLPVAIFVGIIYGIFKYAYHATLKEQQQQSNQDP